MGLKGGGYIARAIPLRTNAPLKSDPSKPLKRTKGLTPGAPPARTGGDRGKTPQRASSNEAPSSVRAKVYERDGNCCVRCGKELEAGNRQLQHRVPRGMGGRRDHARMSALILLCGSSATDPAGCHHRAESRRLDAQAGGWLVPFGSDPTEHPVLYSDGIRYLLGDNGSKEVAP